MKAFRKESQESGCLFLRAAVTGTLIMRFYQLGRKKKKANVFQGRLSLPVQKGLDDFLYFECDHSRSNAVFAYAQIRCKRNTHTNKPPNRRGVKVISKILGKSKKA